MTVIKLFKYFKNRFGIEITNNLWLLQDDLRVLYLATISSIFYIYFLYLVGSAITGSDDDISKTPDGNNIHI